MKNTYVMISDEFRLVRDSCCMWIERFMKVTKKDKTEDEGWKRVSGYHRTFAALMQSLEWHETLRIDGVETLKELAAAQKAMHEKIKEMCEKLNSVEGLDFK